MGMFPQMENAVNHRRETANRDFPHTAHAQDYFPVMDETDVRAALWANIVKLMTKHYGTEHLLKFAGDTGLGLGTMSRLKKGETAPTLDTISKIATTFELEPWWLLYAEFDPDDPPAAVYTKSQFAETERRSAALRELLGPVSKS